MRDWLEVLVRGRWEQLPAAESFQLVSRAVGARVFCHPVEGDRMSKRGIWLTEKEIGDLIWAGGSPGVPRDAQDIRHFRERPVGKYLIPDFVSFFTVGGVNHVLITELKITAEVSALQQLAEFREVLADPNYCRGGNLL